MDNLISQKLNVFIRKYYKNKVLRSVINALSVMSVGFAVFCIIEYFGWNSINVRTFIFYLYIGIAVVMAAIIVFPLFKMFRIGKTLSYRQAAEIIGRHFPQIQDKLLNLLQLQQMSENSQSELLIKAIEQKTEQLSPIPFHKAVNTEKTKKWGKYLLITVGVIGLTAIIFPDLFSQSGKRYINHNTFYEKPAPFAFTLVSPTQTAELNDYTVEVKVSGKMLPEKVNVIINGKTFEMTKKSKSSFAYTITQIQKNTSLQFEAAGVLSRIYNIDVIPKPVLTSIQAEIIYPAYTGIQNETLTDISGLSVPKGTKINWTLKGKDCSYITVASYYEEDKKHSDIKQYTPDKKGSVAVSKTYMHTETVSIRTANARTASSDSIAFVINTVDDEKPSIAVIEQKDSLIADNIFFRGQIKDDYGFSKLEFCMKVTSVNGKQTKDYVERLQITDKENVQEFYHAVSLKKYNISKGDKAEYFFRVWDNDALGAKSSVCQTFTLEVPTESQIEEKLQNNSSEIKQQADKTLDEIKKLQKEIEELTKKLTEKTNLSWQDEKDIQALQQKQQSIQEKISEINKKIQQNAAIENNYNTVDPELLEKQRQIEELFSQLQNNELEKLMQQLKEMIDKNVNKDKINENLKNLNLKNEELSKELDKNLELYKRLEVEKDINNAIDKLNKLAEKQEKLAEQIGKKQTPLSEQEKQQQELNKEFNELKNKLKDIEQKDSQLSDPFNFRRNTQKENDISQQQNQASENLKKNQSKQAAKNQKSAANQMKQMAQQIEQNQQENEQEQLAEDINQVRQILKNLVTVSKRQEELIYMTQNTTVSDPAYQKIINRQNAVKESMRGIADSLFEISKRQPQVSKTINEETSKSSANINKSIENLLKFNQSYYSSFRNTQATTAEQTAMAGMNNLALLLAESLNQMNQKHGKSKKGNASQMCNSPQQSSSGNSPKNMRQLQQALNKEIERLKKELEQRGNSPKAKIGENAQLNERMAKAAAQQEMIRQMMQQYIDDLKKQGGKPTGDMNKMLKQMEETETDIVNKRINSQTVNRQKRIVTRMLESEKAQIQKEKDEQRQSKSGKDINNDLNKNFEAFKQLKNRNIELFKKIPAQYSSYYKDKINKYFLNFEN